LKASAEDQACWIGSGLNDTTVTPGKGGFCYRFYHNFATTLQAVDHDDATPGAGNDVWERAKFYDMGNTVDGTSQAGLNKSNGNGFTQSFFCFDAEGENCTAPATGGSWSENLTVDPFTPNAGDECAAIASMGLTEQDAFDEWIRVEHCVDAPPELGGLGVSSSDGIRGRSRFTGLDSGNSCLLSALSYGQVGGDGWPYNNFDSTWPVNLLNCFNQGLTNCHGPNYPSDPNERTYGHPNYDRGCDGAGKDPNGRPSHNAVTETIGGYREISHLIKVEYDTYDENRWIGRAREVEGYCGDGIVQPGSEECDDGGETIVTFEAPVGGGIRFTVADGDIDGLLAGDYANFEAHGEIDPNEVANGCWLPQLKQIDNVGFTPNPDPDYFEILSLDFDLCAGSGFFGGTVSVPRDGCSAECQVEDGWTCDGADPTVCTEIATVLSDIPYCYY
jgi:hypothetical protein